jgi:hypothetical protein
VKNAPFRLQHLLRIVFDCKWLELPATRGWRVQATEKPIYEDLKRGFLQAEPNMTLETRFFGEVNQKSLQAIVNVESTGKGTFKYVLTDIRSGAR